MRNRKLALSLALTLLLSLSLCAVPSFAADTTTIYFYAGTADNPFTYTYSDGTTYTLKGEAWLLSMSPENGWGDVEGNNWAPQPMTAMGDGWMSYDLKHAPTDGSGIFVQFRNYGDLTEGKIHFVYSSSQGTNAERGATFSAENLWVIPVTQTVTTEEWNSSDNCREVYSTSYATKDEAVAALGLGGDTEAETGTETDTGTDDAVTDTGEKGNKETNPQTGDQSLLIFALLTLVAAGSFGTVLMLKRSKA